MVLHFLFAIIFSGSAATAHDVPIAIFHITESNDILEIAITYDLDDYSESLGINTAELNTQFMQNYLNRNTSFQFNSKVANLEVSEVQITSDHVEVKGNLGRVINSIKTIEIENTCLLNISRHSNVIQIDLNNKSRDFRMHNRRRVINITY